MNKTWYSKVKIKYFRQLLHPHYHVISPPTPPKRNLRLQIQSNHINPDLASCLRASKHPPQVSRSLSQCWGPVGRQRIPVLPSNRTALDKQYIINVPLNSAVGSIILLMMMGREDVLPWADMDVALMQSQLPFLGTDSEAMGSGQYILCFLRARGSIQGIISIIWVSTGIFLNTSLARSASASDDPGSLPRLEARVEDGLGVAIEEMSALWGNLDYCRIGKIPNYW